VNLKDNHWIHFDAMDNWIMFCCKKDWKNT